MHPDDITVAAREMTEAEPPADLELRIMRRLDEASHPTTVRRWPWIVGLATAAATATALIVVMQSPDATKSRSPEVLDVPQSRGPEVPQSPRPEVPESASPVLPPPIRLPAYRSISESELAWMSRSVPALDVIDPIQPEPVSITPLIMTPLMTSPMYGDPDGGRT